MGRSSMQPGQRALPDEHGRPSDLAAMGPLMELRNRIGPVYGSDTISLLFYALIRRERPRNIVEFGTGLGVSAFWMAQAAKENGAGRVTTIDDGSHWQEASKLRRALEPLAGVAPFDRLDLGGEDYAGFVNGAIALLGLHEQLTFIKTHLELGPEANFSVSQWPFLAEPVDFVFLDIFRTPEHILDTLFHILPVSAPCLSLFIDSASTSMVSYLFLETLVEQLNRGKVPWRFLEHANPERRRALTDLIAARRFTLVHLVERLRRAQNSTAWLKIEPIDHRPHPPTQMRWV